jgi:drug/metabolite transporter (DMT)-like permease
MDIKTKGLLGKGLLFCTTLIWGSSFFIMKNTVDSIPVYYLLAIRFSSAAIILPLVFMKRLRLLNLDYLRKGLLLGVFLFCAYVFQTFGLMETTPGKNAFLTTVYCIIVPFLYWGWSGIRPDIYNISASIICVIGIGLVSLNESLAMGRGDALTLVCGLFYALHIVAVARFAPGRDIFLLTIIQFAGAAILSWVFGLLFNTFPGSISTSSAVSLIYLCFFATTIALLLQNIGQKYTTAATAAIILSLESVFGVLFSIIFYHEVLTLRIALGFALIFAAVFISETRLEFLKP